MLFPPPHFFLKYLDTNIGFLIRGHRFKSNGGRVYTTPQYLALKKTTWTMIPCPTNKGFSFMNLVSLLVVIVRVPPMPFFFLGLWEVLPIYFKAVTRFVMKIGLQNSLFPTSSKIKTNSTTMFNLLGNLH